MQLRKLQKVFRKKSIKSISIVEYLVNRSIIHTTTQLQIENVVMEENTSRFSLAYSSPIFEQSAIDKISRIGLTLKV